MASFGRLGIPKVCKWRVLMGWGFPRYANGVFWWAGDSQGMQMACFGGLGIPKVCKWRILMGWGFPR